MEKIHAGKRRKATRVKIKTIHDGSFTKYLITGGLDSAPVLTGNKANAEQIAKARKNWIKKQKSRGMEIYY